MRDICANAAEWYSHAVHFEDRVCSTSNFPSLHAQPLLASLSAMDGEQLITAAAGLAEKIVSDDPQAQRDFIQLLKAGGSNYPYELITICVLLVLFF